MVVPDRASAATRPRLGERIEPTCSLEAVHLDRVRAVVVDRSRQEVILDVRPESSSRVRMKPPASKWLLAPRPVPFSIHSRPIFGWFHHERRVQRDRLPCTRTGYTSPGDPAGSGRHRAGRARRECRVPSATHRGRRPSAAAVAATRSRRCTRTSRRACAVARSLPRRYVTPDARLPSNRMRSASACVTISRFDRTFSLVEVAARGAGAAALRRDGAVHRAEAFLLIAVQIIRARIAGLHTCIDHGLEQRVHARLAGRDRHGAAAAVIVVRADVARFGLLEVRQAVEIRPVIEALVRRPVVVVERVAADVAHAVDQRRAAGFLPRPHSIRRLSMCGSGSVS